MQGSELAELTIFLAVAQLRSFSKAAVERGIAASAVSHAIRKLELRVGVRLFHRTTRSVALTDSDAWSRWRTLRPKITTCLNCVSTAR